jgi:methyl-accepting chemotaxis protein
MKFKENLGAKMAAEALSNKQAATWWSIITALATLIAVGWIGLHIRARLVSSLAEANRLAERVAAGDLSSRGIAASDSDEIGDLMRSMEKMRSDLSVTVGQILSGTEGMVTSSDQLSAAALQVSTSSHQQSSATASAAAAVEQLTVSIDHVGNNAADAHNRAQQAGHTAVESGQGVEMASNRIGEVARSVEHNAQQVQVLSEQVREIGNITTVIRDVADQTNLLALNAAIEAARAGEQGRGFAVVADEVRKLAERTTRSIQEISSVIGSIQNGVAEAVDSMQASRSIVADVVTAAQSASASMQDVRTDTENVGKSISEISSALSEQRMASTDLARNVESIAQMSEENSAAASQVADTANRLVALSGNLKSSVSRFRL